mgnify:FL=1
MSRAASESFQIELEKYLLVNYYKMTDKEIAAAFLEEYGKVYNINFTIDSLRRKLGELRFKLGIPAYRDIVNELKNGLKSELKPTEPVPSFEILSKKDKDKEKIIKLLKGTEGYNVEELTAKIGDTSEYIRYILSEIIHEGYDCFLLDDKYYINTEAKQGGYHKINLEKFENKTYKFGEIGRASCRERV